MKLSEVNKFAELHFKGVDPDLIIQLEDAGCMGHTGVIKAGIHLTVSNDMLINLLPASALIRQPLETE